MCLRLPGAATRRARDARERSVPYGSCYALRFATPPPPLSFHVAIARGRVAEARALMLRNPSARARGSARYFRRMLRPYSSTHARSKEPAKQSSCRWHDLGRAGVCRECAPTRNSSSNSCARPVERWCKGSLIVRVPQVARSSRLRKPQDQRGRRGLSAIPLERDPAWAYAALAMKYFSRRSFL